MDKLKINRNSLILFGILVSIILILLVFCIYQNNQIRNLKAELKFENGISDYLDKLNEDLPTTEDPFKPTEQESEIYDEYGNPYKITDNTSGIDGLSETKLPDSKETFCEYPEKIELYKTEHAQGADYNIKRFCFISEGVLVQEINVQRSFATGSYKKAYLSKDFKDVYALIVKYINDNEVKQNTDEIDYRAFGSCYDSNTIIVKSEDKTFTAHRIKSCFNESEGEGYQTNLDGDFSDLIDFIDSTLKEKGMSELDFLEDSVYPEV